MKKIEYSGYEILNIPAEATPAEMKKAYKSLIRIHTPEHDPEMFKSIRESYELVLAENQFDEEQPIRPMPLYKKPFYGIEAASTNKNATVKLPVEDILANIFETPLDTLSALDNCLHESADKMGFRVA